VNDSLRQLNEMLSPCTLCPRECGVYRAAGQTGFCGAPGELIVASAGPHFGEEAVLTGGGGSGTIFLSGCNLRCLFCQNWDISHRIAGERHSPATLAAMMCQLQEAGCANVNFVTPTHYSPRIAEAICIARGSGLTVPTVYNCGGYERVRTLELLDGLIDIYMPDIKFLDALIAARLTDAPDYPLVVRAAVREMHRQVGDLRIEGGLAVRGLLVRHLVMPNGQSTSSAVLDFLAEEIGADTFVNVMDQYRPCYQASRDALIDGLPSAEELAAARRHAHALHLRVAE
jgi:putative pyruvate formate lyase activating enzyme